MPQTLSRSEYVHQLFIGPGPLLDALRAEMRREGLPGCEVEPEARRVLEITVMG